MTPQEHNKYIGIAHLAYAGLQLLMLLVMLGFIGVMLSEIDGRAQNTGGDPPAGFLVIIFIFAGLLNLILTIPQIIAGYALLKRRSWAKIAGMVGAAVAMLNFPIGAALGAYTFWFLFSDAGRQIYDKDFRVTPPQLPPPPPSDWQAGRV